jgi:ABC-type polysaccharide/polyol phosphate export permease
MSNPSIMILLIESTIYLAHPSSKNLKPDKPNKIILAYNLHQSVQIILPFPQTYSANQSYYIHHVLRLSDYFSCMVSYSSRPLDSKSNWTSSIKFSLCDFPLTRLTYHVCQDSVKLLFILWVTLRGIDVTLTCHMMNHPFYHFLLVICLIQIHVISILV